ncbi:MAG TPA: zinc ABC transporter substrate-binding protein [Jatrophihabitantaceae bacterium]|jgi:zinc/manganese transport system substrate-binding protein
MGRRYALTTALSAAAALLLVACGSSSDPEAGNNLPQLAKKSSGSAAAGGKLGVVAAENFWGNITAQIGGKTVEVTSIISDPNTDPHEYETNAKDGAAIAGAGFVIENGAGYDDFVDKLLKASPMSDREVLNVADVVGAGDDPNPHLWYNPAYVTKAAQAIEAQLAKEDPAHVSAYQANLATFLAGEQQVVGVIDQIKAKYAGDKIAYTERVPGYLVEAAGLKLGTPASFSQAIEDGNDPSPGDNAKFQLALKDHKVKALLYNAQVTSPITQRLKSLASSSAIPVVGVTETMPPDEKNFQTWQADQARALLAALGG